MRNIVTAAAFALSLVFAGPAVHAQDEAGLDELRNGYIEATNANDAGALAALHSENARLFPPGSDMLEGRAAIEAYYSERFEMSNPSNFSLESVERRPLGDAYLDTGAYSMDATIPGGQALTVTGNYVALIEESDGEWLITVQIFNENTPAPR